MAQKCNVVSLTKNGQEQSRPVDSRHNPNGHAASDPVKPQFNPRSLVVVLVFVCFSAPRATAADKVIFCRGMCDASAVVALGDQFLVADDEDNILRVYARAQSGAPTQTLDLSRFLAVDSKSPEADLEGAAPVGDRVYWISSHARNKDGKVRASRQRFFATTTRTAEGALKLEPVGKPYHRLLDDLLQEPGLRQFHLRAAAGRSPKSADALNIEGLCATAEGHLLIGFRNPLPQGRALLVPLLNPAELIEGRKARFGTALLLDLEGLGIRSLARAGDRYFIIAGSFDGEGPSALYEWSGGRDAPRRLPRPELAGLNPEAIDSFSENGVQRLLVVSDDGTLEIGGKDCKSVSDPNLKYFRATTIDL